MSDRAPTCLNLLAPNGIVFVEFAQALSGEQSMAVLDISQRAKTAHELEQSLVDLGRAWGIVTTTEIVSRARNLA